ncbi:hypothetical protein SprV_0902696900 [Sparganum proliferum]
MLVQAIEENVSEDYPGNFQQGDNSMVVAELAVSLPFVEMHDSGVFEILRDFSLTPHLLKELRQMTHKLMSTVLTDLNRDRVRSGRFHDGELLHGPDDFMVGGREVTVDFGLHLRQKGDGGGVGDGGGAVEDASEVLGPSL